ncbi:glycoprotein hormone beta-5 [Danaus plexippus]|uniref:Glycoprotein hormone beta 5 n=1 Tax=Danaus plexippus plexippus TaxID=278856 RepID=A0A212F3I6_DANPL|nr:glycoprotein hormone beta-5 [Danaus plexippus]OWR48297.1 glycoprotein hormone beta 5 [Danaus plexippus plexippus]
MLDTKRCFRIVLLMMTIWCVSDGASSSLNNRCKLKRYTHKAVQTDFNGLRCWDDVKILSCWGFCLSYEIAHWQFPYKESHHPVCVHGERKHASVKLRHCDAGVEPGTELYHYVEAVNCKCQVCSSEDTSCEWLPPDSPFGGLIREDVDGME